MDLVEEYAVDAERCAKGEATSRAPGRALWSRIDDAVTALESRLLAAEQERDALRGALLYQPWQKDCEIIPAYMPPFPTERTRPRCVVRHVPSDCFLRYSAGPRTGTFWDIYGDDFQTEALALVELSKAPAPRWAALALATPEGTDA